MTWKNLRQYRQEKNQFQSYYCKECHQRRKCRGWMEGLCCSCWLEQRNQIAQRLEEWAKDYYYLHNQKLDGNFLNSNFPADYYLFHGKFYPRAEWERLNRKSAEKSRQWERKIARECRCQVSPKTRTDAEWTTCESCDKELKAASNKRIIKNRNDPRFWGLEIPEKILCLECLKEKHAEAISSWRKRGKLKEYLQRGYI